MKRPPTLTLDRPTLARAGDLARARRMGEETTSVDLGSSYLARVGAVVEHLQPVRWIDGGVMKNKEVYTRSRLCAFGDHFRIQSGPPGTPAELQLLA